MLLGIIEILAPRSHKALQSNSYIFILIMGSQPSSNFLGIEASSFNFSSLICIIALVMCFVKATFISLVLGVSASFCKNLITSVILQPSKSKSFSSKVKGQFSPIFLKISAHLSGVFLIDFCTFLYVRGTFPTLSDFPLVGGGLLALGVSVLLEVVIVQTLAKLFFLAISSSLSHLACNSANNLILSSILTCMAFEVAKFLPSRVIGLAGILFIKDVCASDKVEIRVSALPILTCKLEISLFKFSSC